MENTTPKRFLLVILDGWGKGPRPEADAIRQARTPVMDRLLEQYPNSELVTHGEAVGLPEGQMGNSEVGHMNLGAGRVVYQELVRINKAIENGELERNPVLQEAFRYARQNDKPLHLLGLVSDGGVHSHQDHLIALCRFAHRAGVPKIFIHAFMDGRDTDPKSGEGFLRYVMEATADTGAQVASVVGRYFAMDRDKRWERIRKAYDLLVHGKGEPSQDLLATIRRRYEKGETDEFLEPIVRVNSQGKPLTTIQDGDAVLFFNFRTDRPRQLTTALTQTDLPDFGMHKLKLHYLTMTRYDDTFQGVHVLLESDDLSNTLGEVFSRQGFTQIRIAETEKYPHVTFFFNGGREEVFPGERRILIPSPKVPTYDLKPEMSAIEVTDAIIEAIETDPPNFICLNYANTDMVGHTGVFEAAVKAAETVDQCLGRLLEAAEKQGYEALILADHGNADCMLNEDGTPNTAHTMNPVPCIFVSPRARHYAIRDGKLGDIAPTILALLDLPAPKEMTGEVLLTLHD